MTYQRYPLPQVWQLGDFGNPRGRRPRKPLPTRDLPRVGRYDRPIRARYGWGEDGVDQFGAQWWKAQLLGGSAERQDPARYATKIYRLSP
jgi:hypothetical protein